MNRRDWFATIYGTMILPPAHLGFDSAAWLAKLIRAKKPTEVSPETPADLASWADECQRRVEARQPLVIPHYSIPDATEEE